MQKILTDNFGLLTPSSTLSELSESESQRLFILSEGLAKRAAVQKSLWGVGPMPVQKCDKSSGNGRYYPLNIIKPAVTEAQDRISNLQCIGELDHGDNPEDPFPKLKNASHIITKLWLDEDKKEVWGKAAILPTPNGEILHTLLESGVRVGVSVRGVGSVTSKVIEGQKLDYVDDFKIITYEFVSWAGFPELSATNKDMKLIQSLSESLKRTPMSKLDRYHRDKLLDHLVEIRLQKCSPMEKLILITELLNNI